MSVRLYTNNASDTLNGAIGTGDTTITLNDASEFPVPGAGEIAYATIDDTTNVEIITYTGVSTNDLTGVTRGVDGTSGTAFADATTVEVRATASSFEDVLQADETPELQGPLDCSNSGVYIGFGGSSSNTAFSITNSAGVPRIIGPSNFYWGFSGSNLYCQAGTSFNRWEFANDSNRFRIWTNNSQRLSLNDSGLQLGAANARVTTILDEDTMSSDSATALATQQSIKAYVDAQTNTAFSVELSSAQAVPTSTFTKINVNSENFDLNSDFDSTTNYRHTPTKAGKYLYAGTTAFSGVADGTTVYVGIYKNGVGQFFASFAVGATGGAYPSVTCIIDMNGSTDYVELYGWHDHGSNRDAIAASTALHGVKVD